MNRTKDCIVIGMALFAMFFGAGNLIFPPQLGLVGGESWPEACLGFFTTDIFLSIIAIIAIAKAGGTYQKLGDKLGVIPSLLIGVILMLIIGPLLALPRTGAVAYEMGVKPFFDSDNQLLFTLIYFTLAIVFVIKPQGILDKIGKWLTPVLLLSLVVIISSNIISPIGAAGVLPIQNVFVYGLVQGYQTLDGVAAVMFASLVLFALKEKGYRDVSSQVKMTINSSLVAFGIIGSVYAGLMYLGAAGSSLVSMELSRTECFISLVNHVFGETGIWVIAITVLFACFTTTAGLITTVAKYFSDITNHKLSYKFNVIVITVVSFVLSNLSVTQIVDFAGPLLDILYPAVIVLVVIGVFDNGQISKGVYVGGVAGAFIFSTIFVVSGLIESFAPVNNILKSVPLSSYSSGWLIPAITFSLIGYMYDTKRKIA